MPPPNLIQLAPNLTAEERYKLVTPDYHRALMGENPMLSESELQAITSFGHGQRNAWEEYTHSVSMLQWVQVLWLDNIKMERLRVFASWTLLTHATEKILWDGRTAPESRMTKRFESVKDQARFLEKRSVHFYCFPEAIRKIERELYGVPVLNEMKKKEIAGWYETVDDLFEDHNGMIRAMGGIATAKKRFAPIARDMESYLVKKPVPDAALVEQIVGEIREIADLETERLGK